MNGDNQAFKLFGFTDGAVTWGMLVVLQEKQGKKY